MTEVVALRPKTYSYLMDDGNSDKKAEGTKKCVITHRPKFNECKNCLQNHNKDSNVKYIMYILKKLTRFH